MSDEQYNGNEEGVIGPDTNGLFYNDSGIDEVHSVEEYSVDTSEQSYVDGNPQKIHFDNPNWNVPPENQSFTDGFAYVVAIISIVVVILAVYFILRFLRMI